MGFEERTHPAAASKLRTSFNLSAAAGAKVFWFFFSKKNILAFCLGAAACQAYQRGWYANSTVMALLGLAACASRPEVRVVEVQVPTRERAEAGAALNQVPAPLLALGADGRLMVLNRAARALFGAEDVVRDPPPGLMQGIEAAAAGQRAVVKLASRSVAISVAESFGPGGARRLAVLTDVQAEIQAAEAAALRELLAVLGHEIMNGLTPVMSLAESAHAALGETGAQEAREALEIILRRAEGLERFVRGYRLLARVPEPVLRPVGAGAVLAEAQALFAARWGRQGVRLAVLAPAPDLVARMDGGLIGQALLNLLANAAEAALAAAGPPQVWLEAFAAEGRLAFRVRDSGAGVDPSIEASIFQPFFSAKAGGSGIGLTLARQIAQSHGGSLGLEGGAFVLRM